MIRVSLLVICLAATSMAQQKPSDFVLDASRPYVYLAFDHVGPRKPLVPNEGPEGLWLRLVNNCRVPISVKVYGENSDNSSISIFDEVIRNYSEGVVVSSTVDVEEALPPAKPLPRGYSSELYSTIQILPGKDLLFSVPRNHVGPDWFMRVKFRLDVNGPSKDFDPWTELDYFEAFVQRQVPIKRQGGQTSTPPK
jgi:hypothetical protein